VKSHRNDGQKGGFTLIELLVVVAVMMILMGLLVAGAVRLRITAMREGSKAICQDFVSAIEAYQNSYRFYPEPVPGNIKDIYNSGAFYNQFWDTGKLWWKPDASNAAVIYQLLLPIGQGPFLNASSSAIPLTQPKDNTKQPVSITVNNILIRQAVDKFDNPLNVVWYGNATFTKSRGPFNAGEIYWGYFERENNNYKLTTREKLTGTFTQSDVSLKFVMYEYTGLMVWSSGEDGLIHTADDIEAVYTGR